MARYFKVTSTRGKALAEMMEKAKRNPGTSFTVYAVPNPGTAPFWIVGEQIADAERCGMLPVFTFVAHESRSAPCNCGESMRCWPDLEEEAYE